MQGSSFIWWASQTTPHPSSLMPPYSPHLQVTVSYAFWIYFTSIKYSLLSLYLCWYYSEILTRYIRVWLKNILFKNQNHRWLPPSTDGARSKHWPLKSFIWVTMGDSDPPCPKWTPCLPSMSTSSLSNQSTDPVDLHSETTHASTSPHLYPS